MSHMKTWRKRKLDFSNDKFVLEKLKIRWSKKIELAYTRDDAIALYRAFKGTLSLSLPLSLKFLYKHVFTTCLVQRWKSSTKKYEFHNTYRLLHSREPFISFLSIIFGLKGLILLFGFLFYCFRCMSYHMCHPMSPSTNLPKKFQ